MACFEKAFKERPGALVQARQEKASQKQHLNPTALLIVEDDLRCRFPRFKLCPHLLDLRGLLFKGCREGADSQPVKIKTTNLFEASWQDESGSRKSRWRIA